MITIGQLGTFDLENYGDLLYPLVFPRILKRRNAPVRIRPYSLISGSAPLEAGFDTSSIQSLFGQSIPSTTVIGGGDILRTDWYAVARHYSRIYRDYYSK